VSGWRTFRLGDALEIKHGFAFKGEYFSSDDGPYVVLTPGNFRDEGGFKPKSGAEKFYNGPLPDGYVLSPGDIVVAMTEQVRGLLGSSATIPADAVYLHNQRIGLVHITDPEILDARFVYHLFNSTRVRDQLQATATGSKVRHTAPERIEGVRVPVPDVLTQRRIAEILDSTDDLIGNTERRIALLERIAQVIYREWFVHFRYPGHQDDELVDSSLGPIPAGWKVEELSDLASIVMGQSPPSEYYNDSGDGLPFHQGVSNFSSNYPRHVLYCQGAGRLAEAGDHLVSVRAPVGRINRSDQRLVIGRGLAAIRSERGVQSLLGQQLRALFQDEDAMGSGTIFKAITKGDLERLDVVQPTADVSRVGEATLRPIDDLIRDLTFANRALERLRDLLLPKLVTGAIDVSTLDLDPFLEESAA
jgi:type I restriction enzyme S subunit